jgi:pimeloyl-ACP methyl ester carboxylesterase
MASTLAGNVVAVAAATIILAARSSAQTTGEAVASLPAPTGPLPVGTAVAHLRDSSRADADFPSGRPITVQLWYPAARAEGKVAPYLMEPGLGAVLLKYQYYGIDSVTVGRWSRLTTHSFVDAAPATGKHPLLAFSVGLGVIRANYTSIVEELASHGYIVAIVESPLQGLMLLPEGRAVLDSAGRYGETAAHRTGVAEWARDISLVLDRLAADRDGSAIGKIAATIERTRIGALGHSSGGLVAIAACEADARVRACVNMDGGVASPDREPLAEFVSRGITKPVLFLRSQPLYDDTTLARRGMTREQWLKRGEAGRIVFDSLAARSSGTLWVAQVAGTGHFSFSDAPYTMPSAITRFGGRIIAPDRGWRVITTTLRAFFDREFGRGGEDLNAIAAKTPELTVEEPRR